DFHPPKSNRNPSKLPTRLPEDPVLNELGLTGTGVEVGVQEGGYSAILLMNWKGTLLYSVDPWREFSMTDYVDVANISQADQDLFYRMTIKRLAPYQSRSVIWRLTSREAAELIPNESLDFCYLDADHSYKGVCEDIRLWHPKVKHGGILAGHDYVPDGTYAAGVFGVKGAVDEFVASQTLRLFLSGEPDSEYLTWLVVKK
ncbi:MAG: class I SAM-dependent methyltransferase, partial [Verrucomicrobia bacterium]|nr:class I SAM-dependent methyltransferase [Verrucomicrobiota bacterium]